MTIDAMPRSFLNLLMLVFAACFGSTTSWASEPIERQIQFEILNNPATASGNIDQVCCGSQEWRLSNTVEVDRETNIAWIKLPELDGAQIIELSRGGLRMTLYERPMGATKWETSVMGTSVPFSQKALPVPETAFRLGQFNGQKTERFLKIDQPSNVIYIIDTWLEESFTRSSRERFALRIFLIGFCGAMVAFNLVVSLIAKQKIFILNAAMILSLIPMGLIVSGTGPFLLWPESPEWSRTLLTLSRAGSAIFPALFVSEFLSRGVLGSRVLNANRIFGALVGIGFLTVLITDNYTVYFAMILLSGILMLVQIALVIAAIAMGDRKSIIFLVPVIILFAGLSLRWAIMIFSLDQPWLRYHVLEFTLAVEAIAFSLILASRIRYYAAHASDARAELSRVEAESANKFAKLQDIDRSRLAGELHDSLGHGLAMASAQLAKVSSEKQLSDDAGERIDHARAIVTDAISETRRISHDLHPVRLRHLGLKQSLVELFVDLEMLHGIETTLTLDFNEQSLSNDNDMQIYRLVQEAVANVTKHSNAHCCSLTLCEDDDVIKFELKDDGDGFSELQQEHGRNGLGMFTMRQRASLLGGELEIDSGDGVRLFFSFKPNSTK